MMRLASIQFHLILLTEIICYPYFLFLHWYKVFHYTPGKKKREIECSGKVRTCIHEWGGYPLVRTKTIKHGATFTCGLYGQIERFADKSKFDLTVTMSEKCLWNYEGQLDNIHIVEVDNDGMDFSGYETFYKLIENEENCYVILSNSSVNSIQQDFISGYVEYMDKNLDVGALGISYCTKMIQTFIRPNFYPHIQSFFILTTLQVLKEIVCLNGGQFPGKGINNKRLLIRNGEIRLSQLIMKAGYHLAVVNPLTGIPFKFSDYRHWSWPKGDIRQLLKHPNCIVPIKDYKS